MQPAKSSEQIHAHLKKHGCSLENVWKKNQAISTKNFEKTKKADLRPFKF